MRVGQFLIVCFISHINIHLKNKQTPNKTKNLTFEDDQKKWSLINPYKIYSFP